MPRFKQLILALAFAALSGGALAAQNPLSVHVLDLQTGQPKAGVRVTLEQRSGDQWRALADGVTNAQGRVAALYPQDGSMAAGDYRIVFETGSQAFFPRIPVEFRVDGKAPHYHIPLLLSPYGYSTYRGN